MLGPIKCYTCGKVLGDKYLYFQNETLRVKGERMRGADGEKHGASIEYFTPENSDKSHQGQILDNIQVNRLCCRRHLLTHVDII